MAGESVFAGAELGTLSFYPAKVLGAAGDGGGITSLNPKVSELVGALCDHGRAGPLDIVGWAQQLTQLKPRGKNFLGLCPFHKDSKPSFHVYVNDPVKPHAHCFGCDWHGDAADLKAAATGLPLAEILKETRIRG